MWVSFRNSARMWDVRDVVAAAMFVFASVIQFGCGGTFYRKVSVGDNGKFGMTALVLFGTIAASVSSVATFSSGIFE